MSLKEERIVLSIVETFLIPSHELMVGTVEFAWTQNDRERLMIAPLTSPLPLNDVRNDLHCQEDRGSHNPNEQHDESHAVHSADGERLADGLELGRDARLLAVGATARAETLQCVENISLVLIHLPHTVA